MDKFSSLALSIDEQRRSVQKYAIPSNRRTIQEHQVLAAAEEGATAVRTLEEADRKSTQAKDKESKSFANSSCRDLIMQGIMAKSLQGLQVQRGN